MTDEYSYEQGDMVDFAYQTVKGYGEICGCASIAQPIIGRHYIVKVYQAEGIDEELEDMLKWYVKQDEIIDESLRDDYWTQNKHKAIKP